MNIPRFSAILAFLLASPPLVFPSVAAAETSSSVAAHSDLEENHGKNKKKVMKITDQWNLLSTHNRATLSQHWEEVKNEYKNKYDRSLQKKTPKGGGKASLEECLESSMSYYLFLSSIAFVLSDISDIRVDIPDNCEVQGTDNIYCDFSYEPGEFFTEYISYDECVSDSNSQWVIISSKFFTFDGGITLLLDVGLCNAKACDAKALVEFLSYSVTTDVKKVENGPKKKEGTLGNCLTDIDKIDGIIELNFELYSGAIFGNLKEDLILDCEPKKKNVLYCDISLDPDLVSDRETCLDNDDQWVVAKVTAKDPDDGVTVILDNGGECFPGTCDAKALAKKLSKPFTHKIKKIEERH